MSLNGCPWNTFCPELSKLRTESRSHIARQMSRKSLGAPSSWNQYVPYRNLRYNIHWINVTDFPRNAFVLEGNTLCTEFRARSNTSEYRGFRLEFICSEMSIVREDFHGNTSECRGNCAESICPEIGIPRTEFRGGISPNIHGIHTSWKWVYAVQQSTKYRRT